MRKIFLGFFLASSLSFCFGQEYSVTEIKGGPFERTFFKTIKINEGSTLTEKIYLLNTDCGVDIVNLAPSFEFGDRQQQLKATITMKTEVAIKGYKYRISLFNPFGEHLTNLGGGDFMDRGIGTYYPKNTWASYRDLFEAQFLVVYIEKILYEDGRIWKINWDRLQAKIADLKLEKVVQESGKEN